MKNLAVILLASIFALGLASCAPKATPEDCNKACQKMMSFKAPAEDLVAKAEAEHQKKIEDFKNETVAEIEKELQEKLAAATTDEEKEKLGTEYAAKKEEKIKEVQPKLDEMTAGLEAVKKAAEEQVAAAKAASEKALKDCADNCAKAGTPKAKTDCQIKAASLDEYNKCK